MSLLLKKNDASDDVLALQYALNQRLYQDKPLTLDGIFGPHTEAAVRAFQRQEHLTVDGIAGPHTLGALFELGTVIQRFDLTLSGFGRRPMPPRPVLPRPVLPRPVLPQARGGETAGPPPAPSARSLGPPSWDGAMHDWLLRQSQLRLWDQSGLPKKPYPPPLPPRAVPGVPGRQPQMPPGAPGVPPMPLNIVHPRKAQKIKLSPATGKTTGELRGEATGLYEFGCESGMEALTFEGVSWATTCSVLLVKRAPYLVQAFTGGFEMPVKRGKPEVRGFGRVETTLSTKPIFPADFKFMSTREGHFGLFPKLSGAMTFGKEMSFNAKAGVTLELELEAEHARVRFLTGLSVGGIVGTGIEIGGESAWRHWAGGYATLDVGVRFGPFGH